MAMILVFLFDQWWKPLYYWLIVLVLLQVSLLCTNPLYMSVFACLYLITVLRLAGFAIYQFTYRRWWKGIITSLVVLGHIAIVGFIILIHFLKDRRIFITLMEG